MNTSPPELPNAVPLEQLLLRDDLWLGHSQRFTARAAMATGYEDLDQALLNHGWPLGTLVEVCQPGIQGEWQLFTPALLEMPGLILLINPPADPFAQAFIQAGIDLDRLVVLKAADKSGFIASFIEASRASVGALMAWQPKDSMTYTELRKCLLGVSEGSGLSIMFRPAAVQQQSSPAGLRVYAQIVPTGLEVTVFKQKGHLPTQQFRPIILPLPEAWNAALPFNALNEGLVKKEPKKLQRLASVTPLRGKP